MARGNARFTWFGAQTTNGDRTRFGETSSGWWPAALRFEYLRCKISGGAMAPGEGALDDVMRRLVSSRAPGPLGVFCFCVVFDRENQSPERTGEPRHPFSPFAGKTGIGAWEVTFRYAELTFDSKIP